ncbi:MAG: hypothetical protein LBB56_07700 [Chitinispirillales bacterium]|jgi:hypothetical protein|nr:hypothetical protein [Chitinispirillales bacterium]
MKNRAEIIIDALKNNFIVDNSLNDDGEPYGFITETPEDIAYTIDAILIRAGL